MPVDDRTRLNLHRKLEAVLGTDDADTLMSHLPPVTWNEVATTGDLRSQTAVLRSEMQAMGAELRGEMEAMGAELRGEMEAMGAELRGEMQAMGAELRGEMQTMGTGLRGEMQVMGADLRTEFVDGTNRQIKWLVGFAAVWSSLLVTLVGLIS